MPTEGGSKLVGGGGKPRCWGKRLLRAAARRVDDVSCAALVRSNAEREVTGGGGTGTKLPKGESRPEAVEKLLLRGGSCGEAALKLLPWGGPCAPAPWESDKPLLSAARYFCITASCN